MNKLTAEELLNKYKCNSGHAFEVRKLAMMIFDEVSEKIKPMSNYQRKLLDNAALLHDIGYALGSDGHNKHSQHIIIENGINELTDDDTKLTACICRYHRGSLPDKKKHEIYSDLDKKQRKIVKRLGGILKLADGLDRSHLGLIKKVEVNYDQDNCIAEFMLTPRTPEFYPDISAAIKKRDLFEAGFKCQSVLKFKPY